MKEMVFLDFDGVIFDTAYEAYLVSLITLEIAHDLNQAITFVDSDKFSYKWFISERYKIGPAWNYYYLFKSLDTKETKLNIFPPHPNIEAIKFQHKFFTNRAYLRKHFYQDWIGLNKPYECTSFFIDLLNNYPQCVSIVTTKDVPTVETLLRTNGLISSLRIYGSEMFSSEGNKGAIIKSIIKTENVVKAVFVDDCEEHLRTCDNMSEVICLQAKWGYVPPQIKENNFEAVKLIILNEMGFQ